MFDCIRFNVENVTTKYKIFAIWRLHQETPSGLHIEGACWDICNQPPINNSNVDLSRSLSSIGVSKNSPCWYVENNQHKPNYSLHFSLCSFSNVSLTLFQQLTDLARCSSTLYFYFYFILFTSIVDMPDKLERIFLTNPEQVSACES